MSEVCKNIDKLLKERGISGVKMSDDLGMSRSFMTELRKGRAKSIKIETAQKIADYFGVTTDYLFGTETEKAPTPEGERQIGFDDFTYAMHNETKNLPQEKKDMLLQMARFMNAELEKEGQ